MSADASRSRVRTLALALLGAVVVAGAAVPAASAAPVPAPSAHTASAAQFWQWGGAYADRATAEAAGSLLVFSATAVTYYVEYVRQQHYAVWYR